MIIEGHFTLPGPISQKLYRTRPQKLKLLIRNQTSAFRWYECRWPWRYFKVIKLFHIKFLLLNGALCGKSYYRVLIGNHTLAFDSCHFWWPWSTLESHFSLVCHFHVYFSNLWQAFGSRGLPAIAELLVRFSTFSDGFPLLCAWTWTETFIRPHHVDSHALAIRRHGTNCAARESSMGGSGCHHQQQQQQQLASFERRLLTGSGRDALKAASNATVSPA